MAKNAAKTKSEYKTSSIKSESRNKPSALDGALRDALSIYQFSKYQASKYANLIIILSHTMKVSNSLTPQIVKKDIK